MSKPDNKSVNESVTENSEQGYVPNQFDPESVSTKTYLWDLNNQVFELNQNIKTLIMGVNEICAELTKNQIDKRSLPVIGIRQ